MLAQATISAGDTAWVLICAGLVLFMTPGLALFYAGMVPKSNTLVMLQQNIIALGVVSVTWVLLGYTIAFGDDAGGGLFGNLGLFGLLDIGTPPAPAFRVVAEGVTIPALAFVAYQMMFAVITPALATGATAGRLKFAGWAVFLAIWSIIVYAPVAHWLWHPGGWLAKLGTQDWAGGMVVHASAGAAVLALLLVVGRRRNWPHTNTLPNSVPLMIVGAGILWFGWFGFNGGDGLQANGVAAQALINTHLAAAAGMLIWLLMERVEDGHATVVGAVSGAVAGLATITPCAGFVSTLSALAIGAIAGFVCHTALRLKYLFRLDDALDVLAVHWVGGMLGSLLLGLFAQKRANTLSADGLFFGGGFRLLGNQVVGVLVVVLFSFVLTWLIATGIEKTIGLRVPVADEGRLDHTQQGMDAYHLDPVSSLPGGGSPTGGPGPQPIVGGTPVRPKPDQTRLVIGLLDAAVVHSGDLRDALQAAGAVSIVVSEAHVSTAPAHPQVVRGYRRDLELAGRIRVEVLVPEAEVLAVLEVFDQLSPGHPEGFVQVAEASDDFRPGPGGGPSGGSPPGSSGAS
ncbi:ammonium transporter [Micromonospora sp. NPDC003197]